MKQIERSPPSAAPGLPAGSLRRGVASGYHARIRTPPLSSEPRGARSVAEEIDAVYREQFPALVAFATRRLGDRGRAEELAQEAFLRALRERPDNPRAWLYTVVANLARDEGRRRSVRRRQLALVQEEAGSGAEPVDESLDRERRIRRVRAAMATLADRDREALLLKERGHSYDEIAERLGLSRGSVGTTLARARQRLVAAWHALGPAPGGAP